MQSIQLLIFDLDGTLADTRQDLTNSVNHVRATFGLSNLSVQTVMQYVGDGVRKLMERALPQDYQARIDEALALFQRHYEAHALDFTTLYPGVVETLQYFQNKKMAVVSNKPEKFSKNILKGLKIDAYFDVVLGGDSLPVRKPHPDPILKILKQLNVRARSAVMVGDGTTDILAGKQAQVRTCAVTYGFRSRELLQSTEPDFFISRIAELKDWFE